LADELQDYYRKYIYLQSDESNIFKEHSKLRVDTINETMSLDKTHLTYEVSLVPVENFILDESITINKEEYLMNIFDENRGYSNMVKRFDRIYEIY
jgi:hypothetical protein